MAKRVTESISSSTSRPWSRKYSAMRRGRHRPHLARSRAGWSEVATTTTRAGQALGAEVALDELAHLAAALADQGDHVDVGLGVARDHAEQRRLADAGAGEDAEALALAAGDQGVDGAHPEGHALRDRRALQRRGRLGHDRRAGRRGGRRPPGSRRRRWARRGRRPRGRAGSSPTGTSRLRPVATTSSPGRMPCSSPSGISSVRPSRKPTTSARSRARRGSPMRQISPTSASGPRDSMTRPMTSATRPLSRYGSARRSRCA